MQIKTMLRYNFSPIQKISKNQKVQQYTLLVKLWEKQHLYILLEGTQNGITPTEENLEIFSKITYSFTLWSNNHTSWNLFQIYTGKTTKEIYAQGH